MNPSDIIEKGKAYGQKRIVKEIMKLLSKASKENVCRAISLAEKLTSESDYKRKARKLRKVIEEDHPAVELIRKILTRLSPSCRDKLIENFFMNEYVLGISKRRAILAEEGFEPPNLFVISPTMRCNLHCPGCYAGEYEQSYGLSFETIDRIMNEAKELGIYFVTVSGGEVFVRPDMLDIYEKHNDMYFQLYTNGTLIDMPTAQRLSRLGNVAPMISLEGFEKETDARRGKGSYRKIMNAMDYLKDAGVIFGISLTETKDNIDLISSDPFIDMVIDKGAMVMWYFQYIPIGRKPHTEIVPTPEQRDALRRRLREIREVKPIFIGDFWNDGPYVGGCIAGGRCYFHINANGDIEPCVFAHFAVDNIENTTLRKALNSKFFKAIRARQPYRENLLTPCMIIDKPEVLREVVAEAGAHPTHPGAETIITTIAPFLDKYSRAYWKIADRVWEEEWVPRIPQKKIAKVA